MRHAVVMELCDRWCAGFRHGLRGFLALTMLVIATSGSGGLAAEEKPADAADGSDAVAEPTTTWPRRAVIDGWTITVYQPQPERLDGNLLTARAAVSVAQENGEPVFGAEWMSIRLDIDREQRIANASSLSVDRVQFPDGEAGDQAGATLKDRLPQVLPPADLTFNLDDLIATLEQEPTDRTIYSIVPPRIIIRTTPTELVPFDGQPRFETAGGVTLAVNTPAFVCIEANGDWWLRLDSGWLTAPGSAGPWVLAPAPAAVVAAAEGAGLKANPAPVGDAAAPAVIVSTEPTDLVVFNGEPQWTPIADTGILAADNSDRDAFIDTTTRRYWLLLAGRWFSAERLADDASWVATAPNALPAGFAAIPADSRWAHVRVHISGTEEARKAALDAQVPQTARVPRSATITVTYDGEPRFTPIPSSDVAWAENSSFAVFRTPGPRYWCCDQGVWYQSEEATGPWAVATGIPDSLHRIPADNPYHNVTYVYVYDSGPDYVWTGYTSGYYHHYIYYGCPIYGSGWYWRGYYGRPGYVCPRPLTWGVRVTFSPWYYGWGTSYTYRRPHGGVVFVGGHSHSGWWGPTRRVPPPLPRLGRRLPSTTIGLPGSGFPRLADRDTIARTRDSAIYRGVPGAQLPDRPSRRNSEPDTRAVNGEAGEPVFVARDGSVVRRGDSGTVQERRNRTWNDLPATADRGQASTQQDQRLPRVATRPPVSDQGPQRQPNRPSRPQDNPAETPVTQPQPPTDRPQPQRPRRPEEPRPQPPRDPPADPPTTRPLPPTDRPQQPPRRPEEPRPQQPDNRPNDPPPNRPQPPRNLPTDPPATRPLPPPDLPPQQPPRRPEEPRPQPPRNLPADPPATRPLPPVDLPPQQPPRRPEEPRPQPPRNLPADPPATRPLPPVDRPLPPPQPPRRQPEESRPQAPANRPEQAPPPRPVEQPRRQPTEPQPRAERPQPRNDDTRSGENPPRDRNQRDR